MQSWKIFYFGIFILLWAFFITGCKVDMNTRTVGSEQAEKKVLFAGDTNNFKKQVLDKVEQYLVKQNCFIKYIGLDKLNYESSLPYGAIVVVNTAWGKKLDKRAECFLQDNLNDSRVILFTTVHDKNWVPEVPIDAVTSVEKAGLVQLKAEELIDLINGRF